MAVETPQERDDAVSVTASALRALAEAGHAAAAASSSDAAFAAFAHAAAMACRADVGVVRALDVDGEHLVVRAVHSGSPALAALFEGLRIRADELADAVPLRAPQLSAALHLPVELGGRLLGSLEVLRAGQPFDEDERLFARIAADQLALALRALGAVASRPGEDGTERALVLAGEALVAGVDESRTPAQVVRLAVEAADAVAAFLWHRVEGESELTASYGQSDVAETE